MLSRPRANKGFSLVELMVAVGILSVGIITVIQALSFSARSAGLYCDYINGIFLAEDKMQELEFMEKQNLTTAMPKEQQDKKEKFSWKYVLSEIPESVLYRLDFNLSWQAMNSDQEIAVTTYLK